MNLRRLLFWLHLAVGIAVALVVGTLALTGSIIAFQPQLIAAAERSVRLEAPQPGAVCVLPSTLLTNAAALAAPRALTSLTLFVDPRRPAQIALGSNGAVLLADPCTGRILGPGANRLRVFLTTVHELHHTAAFQGVRHETLRALKNAAVPPFIFLLLSGLVLWFPRKRTTAALRTSLLVRPELHGRAREWNLHNVAGFWLCPPLLIIAVTGVIMAYPGAGALLYRAAGETPPAPHKAEPAPGITATAEARPDAPGRHGSSVPAPDYFRYLDQPLARALHYTPTVASVSLRLAPRPPETLALQLSNNLAGQSMNRDQLTLATADASVLRFEPFAATSRGRRWRINTRYLHSGELFGLPGQIVAFTASLGALLLVWTGLSLSLRRLAAWRRRRSRHHVVTTASSQPQSSVSVG